MPDVDPKSIDLWVVDGFNVLHACILEGRDRRRWWSAEAQRKVLEWTDDFAKQHPVLVVFDASSRSSERCERGSFAANLSYAPSADDAIVSLVQSEARRLCVVTADRALRDRCLAVGGTLMRPWDYARLLVSSRGADGD